MPIYPAYKPQKYPVSASKNTHKSTTDSTMLTHTLPIMLLSMHHRGVNTIKKIKNIIKNQNKNAPKASMNHY